MQNRSKLVNPKKAPYGYAFSGPDVDGVVRLSFGTQNQIDIVRWLFWAFDHQGVTCHWLASDLNTRGIPSPSGTIWRSSVVLRILQNRVYADNSHGLALVSVEQFERILVRICGG